MISDRAVKANIGSVDPVDMLNRVRDLPIATWNYTSDDPAIRHIGPMAQDFKAAFDIGEDEKTISTIDADGVALAAIQGLHQELKDRDEKLADQEQRLARQQRELDELKIQVRVLVCLQDKTADGCR
jgi:hypothetical protein